MLNIFKIKTKEVYSAILINYLSFPWTDLGLAYPRGTDWIWGTREERSLLSKYVHPSLPNCSQICSSYKSLGDLCVCSAPCVTRSHLMAELSADHLLWATLSPLHTMGHTVGLFQRKGVLKGAHSHNTRQECPSICPPYTLPATSTAAQFPHLSRKICVLMHAGEWDFFSWNKSCLTSQTKPNPTVKSPHGLPVHPPCSPQPLLSPSILQEKEHWKEGWNQSFEELLNRWWVLCCEWNSADVGKTAQSMWIMQRPQKQTDFKCWS